MSRQNIRVTRTINAPIEDVWALLSQVRTWTRWAGLDAAELERPGEPDANGVAAVRRFRLDRTRTREVITRFDPPQRLSYQHLEGVPIRDYAADVTLTPAGHQSTEMQWEAHFQPQYPGTGALIKRKLAEFIQDLSGKLQTAAEDPPTTRLEAHDFASATAVRADAAEPRSAAAA